VERESNPDSGGTPEEAFNRWRPGEVGTAEGRGKTINIYNTGVGEGMGLHVVPVFWSARPALAFRHMLPHANCLHVGEREWGWSWGQGVEREG